MLIGGMDYLCLLTDRVFVIMKFKICYRCYIKLMIVPNS